MIERAATFLGDVLRDIPQGLKWETVLWFGNKHGIDSESLEEAKNIFCARWMLFERKGRWVLEDKKRPIDPERPWLEMMKRKGKKGKYAL